MIDYLSNLSHPDTRETELKEVVQTFVRETNELVHIKVNGEEIITTPTHPFWVPQKGWTDAIQLRAGDRLQLLNGEYVIIEQVQHEILEAPVTVYNFEVEGFHTYFVGETSVLVHNLCEVKSSIKKSNALVKEANKLSGRAQDEINDLVSSFIKGNNNPGLGSKHLAGNIYYLRGRNGGRVFYRMVDGTMDILGKATKSNEQKVINLVLQMFR